MSSMGKNLKITMTRDHRTSMNQLFTGPLGAKIVKSDDTADIYRLEDGNVGCFFAEGRDALAPVEAQKSTWLEFLVDDPASLRGELEAAGARRVDYHDKAHDYWAASCGVVFRLSARSEKA